MKHLLKMAFLSALAAVFAVPASAQAQIVWQGSVNIFEGDPSAASIPSLDESFVSTTGTLFTAVNAGPLSPTVNGVTFTAFPEFNGTNPDPQQDFISEMITVTSARGNADAFNNNDLGEFGGNVAAEELLQSGFFQIDSITLSGLTEGDQYQIQIFGSDARVGARDNDFFLGLSDGVDNTAVAGQLQLSNRPPGAAPGTLVEGESFLGDTIIGTFTAGAEPLTIALFGSNNGGDTFASDDNNLGTSQINAIQIRNVTGIVIEIMGDFDGDMDVDCDDLDGYIGNIDTDVPDVIGGVANLDFDSNGMITLGDAISTITDLVVASNGITGTLVGDFNCDGSVDVLNDAFALVGNLGGTATSYSQGDTNFDGAIDVLNDAFTLVGNLGSTNEPATTP